MKQPKPMEGQIWKRRTLDGEKSFEITYADDNFVRVKNPRRKRMIPIHRFLNFHAFIPQNDLEWLAVNVDEWPEVDDLLLIKSGGGAIFIEAESVIGVPAGHFEFYQHRNERYRLGLDTKPHYKLINGQWSETK